MYRTALALVTLVPSLAWASGPRLDLAWHPSVFGIQADDEETPTDEPQPEPEPEADEPEKEGRQYKMEVNFRGRYVFVPRSIFNIWYYDEDDEGWPSGQQSPTIHGYALGLEYVIKGDSANGIFYVEWIKSLVTEGYWDDREEPPDHTDGDYLVPTPNLGLVAFGADYAYEVYFVRSDDTNGAFAMSFLVGGGLGLGVMIGYFDRWGPEGGVPGYERYGNGEPADGKKEGIPKVVPMVDVNAGLRFIFGDRIVLRLEGGLHSLIYGGATLGIMF